MSFLADFLLLLAAWICLTFIIAFLVNDPDIRRSYYEARLDFMIWLAQSIMRERHRG